MSKAAALLQRVGAAVLDGVREAGGALVLGARCARASVSPHMEWREALRQAGVFGFGSLAVLAATSALVGAILVVQAGLYVKRFGAHEIVGWAAGYGILRDVGPLLAGLVFSGRVGSRNAAEIAAMRTRDQLEGLRAIGVDAVPVVVAPRAVAMTASLLALFLVGSAVAVLSAAAAAQLMLGVDWPQFARSFAARTELSDLASGALKSVAFALAAALVSCRAGLRAEGGASAVGAAAKSAVVRSALAIVMLDLAVAKVF